MAVWYYSESKTSFAGFYITVLNGDIESSLNVSSQFQLPCFGGKCSDVYSFGWKYLEYGYSDWNMNTMADMVNGKFLEYVKKETKSIINELPKIIDKTDNKH